jgi:hypothetical protein
MTVKRRKFGTGHAYYVDGEKVPGVTTVLGDTVPKNLTDWAARCAADHAIDYWPELEQLRPSERHKRLHYAYRDERDAAARRGTEVHRLAEQLNNDEEVIVPEELAGHVEAYRDFLDTIEPRPLQGGTELVVANRTHRYCGSVDLIADLPAVSVARELIRPCRWLLELKTTRSGVWPESALQACAYEHAEVFVDPADPDDERKMDWLQIVRCGVVWIRSDAWELRPVYTGDLAWSMFLRLREQYEQLEKTASGRGLPSGWIGDPAAPAPDLAAANP